MGFHPESYDTTSEQQGAVRVGVMAPTNDAISPSHYKEHPSGVECITIAEHFGFCLGNAIKYIWRAGLKSTNRTEDLKKARWYLEREIARLEGK